MTKLHALVLGLAVAAAALAADPAPAASAALYIDTDTTLSSKTMGFGFQWDPNDVWDYTDAQWARVYERVDFLRPRFVRVCTGGGHYCRGFNAQGEPVYTWDSAPFKRLRRILDYCQAHDVEVMLGEWGPPFGMAQDDPRWSRLIADCLDHLVVACGYTCIRYYNKINEPRGDWARYQTWLSAQRSLHDELRRRGLLGRVILVGPDHSEGTAALDWVDFMLRDGAELFGAYETHWYARSDTEVVAGRLEPALRGARAMVDQRDPQGRAKRFFMGEAGTAEWLNGRDSNRYIRDYAYGVYMADYAAQTMRAGLDGVSAWMLDDPMHQQPGSHPPGGVPSGDPKVDFDFKVWGMWNTLGSAMGTPEDEALRPWFYTWSLVSRLFPRGARTVACTDPHLPGVRLAAAVIRGQRGDDLSLMLVNDTATPRELRVVLPNARGSVALTEYRYFEGQRPVDAKGFPVPAGTRREVRLAAGETISLPGQGVVFLTTLDQPKALALGSGAVPPVTWIGLTNPCQTVPVGGSLQLTADTDPRGRPMRWTVTDTKGLPTSLATIDAGGIIHAKGLGRVRVVASAGAVSASLELDLARDRVLTDPLDDWHLTHSHGGGLVFDTINNQLFDGDPSRVKRNTDVPLTVVYHYPGLTDFVARVYVVGELGNKLTVAASADGTTWAEVPVTAEPLVPTGSGFARTTLRPARLPAGTNYLRFELANDTVVWSPQLAEVKLVAAR